MSTRTRVLVWFVVMAAYVLLLAYMVSGADASQLASSSIDLTVIAP